MESSARCDVPDIPYVGIERGHNFRGWKAVYQGKVQDGLPRRKCASRPTARAALLFPGPWSPDIHNMWFV